MPSTPSPAKSHTSRQNGARSALNGVRHGMCGRTFFLLPDEDPAEFERHEALWLAAWAPCDLHEHEAAGAAIRAMWREERADRLADEAERDAAKTAAFKALGTLLRYRGRIEREHRAAMQALESLRQHRLARLAAPRPSEPERAPPAADTVLSVSRGPGIPALPRAREGTLPSEPEPARALNRHQRRAMAAMSRRAA